MAGLCLKGANLLFGGGAQAPKPMPGYVPESQLTSALFYKDQAGRMNSKTIAEDTRNNGFV